LTVNPVDKTTRGYSSEAWRPCTATRWGGRPPTSVVKIALTAEQARAVYPDRDGRDSIQVVVLPTAQLRRILREAITRRTGAAVRAVVLERGAAERSPLLESVRQWQP
jgi:hypothetical protein